MRGIIPELNAVGAFKLKAPYDKTITKGVAYTCKAITKISQLLANDIDPYLLYYKPYEVSENEYLVDMEEDKPIISLYSATGLWAYVPSSFILGYPAVNGIPYTAILLGVQLGAIPNELPLEPFIASIGNFVRDRLGIEPLIKPVAVSPTALVQPEDHAVFEEIRKNRIQNQLSDSAQLRQTQVLLQERNEYILQLEQYIHKHLDNAT